MKSTPSSASSRPTISNWSESSEGIHIPTEHPQPIGNLQAEHLVDQSSVRFVIEGGDYRRRLGIAIRSGARPLHAREPSSAPIVPQKEHDAARDPLWIIPLTWDSAPRRFRDVCNDATESPRARDDPELRRPAVEKVDQAVSQPAEGPGGTIENAAPALPRDTKEPIRPSDTCLGRVVTYVPPFPQSRFGEEA